VISAQSQYRRGCFVIDGDVLDQFKEAAKQEDESVAKVVEQFLFSYVYCLDSTFVYSAAKARSKRRREPFVLRLSTDIYNAFMEKANKANMDMNLILQQFLVNYVVFMKSTRASRNERAN
jgi:hypothetical protein